MKKYLIISLIIFIVGCSSDEYKIEKGKIGKLNTEIKVQQLDSIYKNDSIVKRIGEGDYMFSGDDKYLVFDSNKNHLLTLTPRNQHDNNETIETIEIVSSFFKTDNGVTIESTFGMIEKYHKINSIQNTINNLIIYVDEIDAYFIIDKQNLPIDLRLGTEKIIKSINIPPESKIKRFMIGWN
ncbi:MAG: hypothetical protein HOB57_02395 [Flavobacteriaceae bacterium]|jgi:hypothetical protein|nr:hypothetical protein [Flavobacteriaceae bacterium]MDC1316377.1 hypothetical protein [Flavobacteriaceae bacterium]